MWLGLALLFTSFRFVLDRIRIEAAERTGVM
jgi:hypothetical protein